MTRLIVAAEAESDLEDILDYLVSNAGRRTAAAYGERFADAIDRILTHPGAGAPRPVLGPDARISIVYPYILIYDFVVADDSVTLLRVLHGKRDITERMIKRED